MKHVQFEMNLPSPTSSKAQEIKQTYEGEIEVFIRKAYGKTRYYPMNALAHLLAKIANSKCLSMEQLLLCKEYGFLITIMDYPITMDQQAGDILGRRKYPNLQTAPVPLGNRIVDPAAQQLTALDIDARIDRKEKKEVPPCEFNMVMDAIEKAMEKKL